MPAHPPKIRTVRLGRPFRDGQRFITIRYTRSTRICACGLALHKIDSGELNAQFRDTRSGQHQHWHTDHLQEHWKLIVIDDDGNEIARFGC